MLLDKVKKIIALQKKKQKKNLKKSFFLNIFLKFNNERFFDKTGNKWENRFNFKKLPNKYHIIEINYNDSENDDQENKKIQSSKISIPNSRLHKKVYDLICLICDVKQMYSTMVEFELDIKKMPLGIF